MPELSESVTTYYRKCGPTFGNTEITKDAIISKIVTVTIT